MTQLVETVRVKSGKAPLWPYHLVRLARSAKAVGLTIPTLVAPSGGEDRVLRYAVGKDGFTLVERAVGATTPVKLGVARGPHAPYPHKTDDRAQFDRALEEATARGEEDAILLNGGSVAECARWSCFWWEGGQLAAPPLGIGILLGVARTRLNELAGGIMEGQSRRKSSGRGGAFWRTQHEGWRGWRGWRMRRGRCS